MNAPDNPATEPGGSASAQRAALEAIAYTGLDRADVRAAILAGCVSAELLLAVAAQLPAPRPILLLDTIESLEKLEQRAERGELPPALAERCTTIVITEPATPFCAQSYVAIWEFLMANDLEPSSVALCGQLEQEHGRGAFVAAVDLLLSHSSSFLARVERSHLPIGRVVEWALFIARHGSAFHALKLLYALGDAVPRTTLAPNIIELWAALGCPEPAFEWLDELEPEQRQQCEEPLRQVAAAREQILGETLGLNRLALQRASFAVPEALGGERHVHIALLPNLPWVPAPGFGARRERYTCLFRIQNGQIVELSPPVHPRTLFDFLRKPRGAREAVALIGKLASPTTFQLIAELQPITGLPDWKQKVYVVEEDPDVAQAFLSTLSLEHPLSEDRFEFLLGPDAMQRLERRLSDNPLLPLPEIIVEARREQVDALVRARDQREARTTELIEQLPRAYTPERLAELPSLLQPGAARPLRALIYTSFFTTVLKYQARDMATALTSLGHQVVLLHEGHPTHLMTTHAILQTISDFDPDLIYCLDVIRPSLLGIPPRLPVLCWIQDELPRLTRSDWIAELGPLDFTFCLSAEWTRRYKKLGYPHTAQLSMAADPTIYAPPGEHGLSAQPGPEQRPPSASSMPPAASTAPSPGARSPSVVMITHVQRPVETIRGLFAFLEPVLRREVKIRPTVPDYDGELYAAAATLGIELDAAKLDEARRCAHMLARHVELTTVARWLVDAGLDVGLYGKGWREIPELSGYARGVLRSGRELSAAYSAAKVVLNINGTTNCHVRVFECLAAGGLPLCRSHQNDNEPGELNDALLIGQEVLCFDGRQDLLQKLGRLLGDEPYRRGIADAGRRRVLNEHCMKHRMQRTLDEVARELLGRAAESGLRPRAAAETATEQNTARAS